MLLENQIKALTDRPPAPRPGISTRWDWRCSCGRLVFAGKRSCDICGCSRAYSGATVAGSVRGVLQTSPLATAAVVRQQRVPGMAPATYAAAVLAPSRPQPTQQRHREQAAPQQHQRTDSALPRGARSQATPPATKEAATEPRAKEQDAPGSAKQLLNAENEETQDDVDEQTTFEDADADPKVLRFRHINLCRKIESKQRQLEKQHEAIEEQKDEMAAQQAKLVQFQAAADGANDKIRELQEQSASIALQIARIEQDRKNGHEAIHNQTVEKDSPPEAQAAECLGKAAAALQGFQSQNPQIQLLLQQFITFIDQLRAGETASPVVDPRQTTLPHAFASAAVVPQTGGAGPDKDAKQSAEPPRSSVPCFDISGSQGGEEHPIASTSEGAAPMAVVGECVGDKRKSDCLLEPVPAGDSAEAPAAKSAAEDAGEQLGTPLSIPMLAVPAFVPQNRAELRVALALRNKQQCQERKSRTEAQHQKSCPY